MHCGYWWGGAARHGRRALLLAVAAVEGGVAMEVGVVAAGVFFSFCLTIFLASRSRSSETLSL